MKFERCNSIWPTLKEMLKEALFQAKGKCYNMEFSDIQEGRALEIINT